MGSDLFVQCENGKTACYDIIHETLFKCMTLQMFLVNTIRARYCGRTFSFTFFFFCIIIVCLNVFPRLPSHNIRAILLFLATEFRHWIANYSDDDKVRRYEVTYLICVHGIF
jgi:hypothetical protein